MSPKFEILFGIKLQIFHQNHHLGITKIKRHRRGRVTSACMYIWWATFKTWKSKKVVEGHCLGSVKVVRLKEGNAVCNKCNWQVNISLVEIQGPSDKKVKRENLFSSTKRSDSPTHWGASDAGIKPDYLTTSWFNFHVQFCGQGQAGKRYHFGIIYFSLMFICEIIMPRIQPYWLGPRWTRFPSQNGTGPANGWITQLPGKKFRKRKASPCFRNVEPVDQHGGHHEKMCLFYEHFSQSWHFSSSLAPSGPIPCMENVDR